MTRNMAWHMKRTSVSESNHRLANTSAERPKILFFGDPHGDFDPVLDAVERLGPEAIVLLGDLQARQPLHLELAPILEKTIVAFIHGNHDKERDLHARSNFGYVRCSRTLWSSGLGFGRRPDCSWPPYGFVTGAPRRRADAGRTILAKYGKYAEYENYGRARLRRESDATGMTTYLVVQRQAAKLGIVIDNTPWVRHRKMKSSRGTRA